MKLIMLALFIACLAPASHWQQQPINTDADFRGVCAVSTQVAWVSGTKGTFGRTVDGGKTWQAGTVAGAEKLDFRDVEAFSEKTAYLLSIGQGENSRIYKTTDGAKSWQLQFKNSLPDAFFDAIAFWDEDHGIALSDPVKGHFHLIATSDGGLHWQPLPPSSALAALPNEGSFAASGTCLITQGENDVWFASGGAKVARIFHSRDRGQSWTANETPIVAGKDSAGIFSIAFRDKDNGVIVGGDYRKPNDLGKTAAVTSNGGKTWKPVENQLPFRSGVAWSGSQWIAVGTSGSHFSLESATWHLLDRENYNCIHFAKEGTGWAAGPKGRIAKFEK
jgi:photosystem II stability/assembly factor-like uncharacterized protein